MTLAVGLVGAGPWAKMVHAPVFAAGPETRLAGVWARREDAAERLATRYGAPSFATVDELFVNCDVVAFAVPPDVQAAIALRAAKAGKHLVLEKPIALGLRDAERLADEVDGAGVASVVVLSWRYSVAVREFVDACRALPDVIGARGLFVSSAFLGGPFATPWRLSEGPLMDLGPHVLDQLYACVGRITSVAAHGARRSWVGLLCEHEGGAVSEVSLCGSSGVSQGRSGVEVYSSGGVVEIDCASAVGPDAFATLRAELASAVESGARHHPLDVHRGVHLQRLLSEASAQL